MGVWTIARLTFHEARRSRILVAALVLSLAFLVIFGAGINFIQQELNQEAGRGTPVGLLERAEMFNFLMMAGLYVVNFLTVMMSVLTSVGTLSGEIASGTIHTLVSKPIHRWEVVLGKWVGYAGMLSLYLGLLGGGVVVLVWVIAGYLPSDPLVGLGLMWLNALLLLSVTLFGGAVLTTLTNGVLVFGLFGLAFVGGWIEQVGAFLENQTAVNIGILTSLALPSEALWRRAAFSMQSPLVGLLGGFSPFTSGSVPSPVMVGYAAVYTLIALGLAVRYFNRRDL